jgi:colanic acid biosynthesis glycosyl transferase WcaI
MYEPVPLDELGKLLNSADAHFLFQKTDVLDSVMPSKIMAMMASKRPSIITGHKNSEVATIFNKNNIGYYFSSENEEKIVDTLRELMNDKSKSEIIGKNAYEYILNNFEEKTILGNMNAKLKSILNE